MDIVKFTEADKILFLSLMLLGYIIAKWTKLDNVDNRYIELILMVIGGIAFAVIHNDVYQFVYGCFIGIASAGSYNLINNLPELLKERLMKNE